MIQLVLLIELNCLDFLVNYDQATLYTNNDKLFEFRFRLYSKKKLELIDLGF